VKDGLARRARLRLAVAVGRTDCASVSVVGDDSPSNAAADEDGMRGRRIAWIVGAAAALALSPAAMDVAANALHDTLTIRWNAQVSAFLDSLPYRVGGGVRCAGSNECSAISTLRSISSAEAQFQATALADEDRDGTGEYGGFVELSAAGPVRGRDAPMNPPVLSGAFRRIDADGQVPRSGYLFRIWIPGKDGAFVGETSSGFAAGRADPDAAERRWRCFAWPTRYDHSGIRSFAADDSGDIFSTDDERWSGAGAGPTGASLDGRPNAQSKTWTSPDGHVWIQID